MNIMQNRTRPITSKLGDDSTRGACYAAKPRTATGRRPVVDGVKTMAKPISAVWSRSPPLHKPLLDKRCLENDRPLNPELARLLRKNGYAVGWSIGEGSYCKVRTAHRIADPTKRKIVCKIIDRGSASADFVSKFLPRELEILMRISHPNIVAVYDIFDLQSNVFIFMEFCEKGDLLDLIRLNGAVPEEKARKYFRHLVSAVEYLHSQDIAHRDLKCENVLLTKKDQVKLADFGFARLCRNEEGQRILSETFCGSAAYAAPEILRGLPYNPKMYDMWSLGCVLYIMLTASMPFDDSNVNRMLESQLSSDVSFSNKPHLSISPLVKRFIMHLLTPDVTERATMTQVTKSVWLQTYNVSTSHPPPPQHSAKTIL